MSEPNAEIKGYLLVLGKLTNLSPLIMGGGEGTGEDDADKMLTRSADGKTLWVHGSALGGCIKSWMEEHYQPKTSGKEAWEYFWGGPDKYQSHFMVETSTLELQKGDIETLEFVRINEKTGTVDGTGKYNSEALNIKKVFDIRFLVPLRGGFADNQVECLKEIVFETGEVLMGGVKNGFTIGAGHNIGFGHVTCTDYKVYHFDFLKNRDASLDWFCWKSTKKVEYLAKHFREKGNAPLTSLNKLNVKEVMIKAPFRIKRSLISGVRPAAKKAGNHEQPDLISYIFDKNHALTGKSIKGALLKQMRKILNTLVYDSQKPDDFAPANLFIEKLNGFVREKTRDAAKGRFQVLLMPIDKQFVKTAKQHRVRIDMFNMGSFPGAKFDSVPIWPNLPADDKTTMNGCISLRIKSTGAVEIFYTELALVLFALMDVADGITALGGQKNIGRGILYPVGDAKLYMDNQATPIHLGLQRSAENWVLPVDLEPMQSAWENFLLETANPHHQSTKLQANA